jgi:hypothetical protein
MKRSNGIKINEKQRDCFLFVFLPSLQQKLYSPELSQPGVTESLAKSTFYAKLIKGVNKGIR